jgi:beta-ureidopropionase / N-carbamoyl-L-amino-acid hydrolase
MSLSTILALVNTTRVLDDLDTLRSFGATSQGRWGRGVSRRGLTPADLEARRWLVGQMDAAGLATRLDGIGTVYGEGGDASRPALLMGSHTDTQPEGGWLDGALGVIYALEAARVLREAGAPGAWAVIDFQDEEGRFGTLVGSRAFAGLNAPPLEKMEDARSAAGLSGVPLVRWDERGAGWLGYLEGHIEQGPRLEAANASVGVVDAIVGMRQMRIFLTGVQGHAGGCPMDERADAGLAAMRLAAGLDAALHAECDGDEACAGAVWTFPQLAGFVSHSTIPGQTELTLQFRAAAEEPLQRIERIARAHCEGDRRALGLPPLSSGRPVECRLESARDPLPAAPMDPDLVACVTAASRLAVASPEARPGGVLTMASRAIHDASLMASRMPAAMLFVPSIGGVSHSFDEHTHALDIAVGAKAFVGAAAGILLKQCAAAPE